MTEETNPVEKKRHGCLTAYLIFMIVANSASSLAYLLMSEAILESLPEMPVWGVPVFIGAGVFNLICAIALLKWKKWGFWGFMISSSIILMINLKIGIPATSALGGILGIAVLYGVLQIGKDNKGWPQLD